MIFHPAYERGVDPVTFPARQIRQFKDIPLDNNYHDPLGDRQPLYEGRWLAGSAAIPGTDFFVIVQVRAD